MKFPVVAVTWVDSHTVDGWQDVEEVRERGTPLTEVRTVGFLIQESDEAVVITSSMHDDGEVISPLTIPRCAVRAFRVVGLEAQEAPC